MPNRINLLDRSNTRQPNGPHSTEKPSGCMSSEEWMAKDFLSVAGDPAVGTV
jgi:hypothetical protein